MLPRKNGVMQGLILDHIWPYDFRQSFRAWYIWRLFDIRSKSKMMGHDSIAITIDGYGHLLPSSLESLLASFDKKPEQPVAEQRDHNCHRAVPASDGIIRLGNGDSPG